MNLEKVKCIADDNGWVLLDDRPHDHFCRFTTEKGLFTLDVYYSKKGSVGLKQKQGNKAYFQVSDYTQLERVFQKPMKYYKAAHTVLN